MATIPIEIKHRFTGGVLFTAQVDASITQGLRVRAALQIAVSAGAYLEGANLEGANLEGAYLEGANLARANLARANHVIDLGCPNGFRAYAWNNKGALTIQAGCQMKSLPDARAYWANKPDRAEIMAALDYAETVARLRKWKLSERVAEAAQ